MVLLELCLDASYDIEESAVVYRGHVPIKKIDRMCEANRTSNKCVKKWAWMWPDGMIRFPANWSSAKLMQRFNSGRMSMR